MNVKLKEIAIAAIAGNIDGPDGLRTIFSTMTPQDIQRSITPKKRILRESPLHKAFAERQLSDEVIAFLLEENRTAGSRASQLDKNRR